MKKFWCFSFLSIVYAGSVFASTNSEQTHPTDYHSGFYVKLTGAALLPSETGIGSFTDSWQFSNADGSTIRSQSIPFKPDYKFAWGVLVGYDASSQPNFAEAEYFYLSNSTRNINNTSDGPPSFGSVFYNQGFTLAPGQEFVTDACLIYRVNQVDARVGHRFYVANNHLEVSPSIGVRWSDLIHNLSFGVGHIRTSYWGVGPVFGIDGVYTLYKGLKLLSHFDAALVVGCVKADSKLDFMGISKYISPNTNRVVPIFGAKLGLRYDFIFSNQSSLRIEAGYQVVTYVGVFDIITGFTEIPQVQVQRIASITTNKFSYSGPYASIAFHM